MNVKNKRRRFLVILILLPYTFVAWSVDNKDHTPNQTIFFYNPEANINNFVSLKMSFDTYLSKFGSYLFQPFNNKSAFEQSILTHQQGLILLSNWHFQYLPDNINLQPVMVGVLKGQSTQKKVLVVNQSITNITSLKGKTIASSGSEDYTIKLLQEMLGNGHKEILKSITYLLVPKDIDALMAISFGMATAAISSETSFENLNNINPKQYQNLNALLKSGQQYFTLATLPSNIAPYSNKLVDILEKMGINPEGELRLRQLGLDGWRRLSSQEQLLLKQQRHKGL